jgi:hypothetical protein
MNSGEGNDKPLLNSKFCLENPLYDHQEFKQTRRTTTRRHEEGCSVAGMYHLRAQSIQELRRSGVMRVIFQSYSISCGILSYFGAGIFTFTVGIAAGISAD